MNRGKSGAQILRLQDEVGNLKSTLLDKDEEIKAHLEEIAYLKDEIEKLNNTLPALDPVCCSEGSCKSEELEAQYRQELDENSVLLAERDQADEKVLEQDKLIQAKNEQLLAFKNILESEALGDLLTPIEI